MASIHNYPGGDALTTLHTHLSQSIHPSSFSPSSTSTCASLQYSPSFTSAPRYTYLPSFGQERDHLLVHSSIQDTVCPHDTTSFSSSSIDYCIFSLHIDAASAIAGITRSTFLNWLLIFWYPPTDSRKSISPTHLPIAWSIPKMNLKELVTVESMTGW